MANFARIIDGVAVDFSTDPAEHFHPVIAAEFVAVPDDVAPGWRFDEGDWLAPEEAEEPEPVASYPKVSPVEFKLLFTVTERVEINAAKATDEVLAAFFEIIDDPRLTFVDLGLQSTQDGLTYLVGLGLITAERRAEVLTGALQ